MTDIRIAFVGDSITLGTADTEFLGWPGRLCQKETSPDHDISLYNMGIRSDTSEMIAARWRAECEARLATFPNAVLVFSFGVNDATLEDGVMRVPMATSLVVAESMMREACDWRQTLWVGPPAIDEARQPVRQPNGRLREKSNARTAEYSDGYARIAERLGIPYFDMLAALAGIEGGVESWAGMNADGVHPTGAGYGVMADLLHRWPAWRTLFA
jgi:acyl-CoA thioesterase I